ncbi:hypothetical protein, partial [Staphylococcus aureus]|uniref:hypothetical protein n=1 Tax=Staphylococcus aureus TaxID=1280 RepID=UPI00210CFBA7
MADDAKAERDLLVLSPLVFSGHFKSRIVHEINSWITAATVRAALPVGARPHVLINTPLGLPVLRHLCLSANAILRARLVYDVIDDFTIFDWSPGFSRQFDQELTQVADRVIAGTHELADSRENAVFIPCGVDFDM